MLITAIHIFFWFKANQTMLLGLVTTIVAIDHALAGTDAVKASSTFQFVHNFIGGFLNVVGLVYKISTGKVLVIPTDAVLPAPTAAQEIVKANLENAANSLSDSASFKSAFTYPPELLKQADAAAAASAQEKLPQ